MKESDIVKQVASLITPENIQMYILGSKKNGQPRALYDIIKDFAGKKKKKKKKAKLNGLYFDFKKKKKKKKNWEF